MRALFERALEAEPQHAERLVREAAAGDVELADDVLELLARHGSGGKFLATPLATPFADLTVADGSWIGHRLGPYRIVRLIAAGGMGVVYEAEQHEPHRRIALKVLRAPLPGSDAERRFREEAEILARLRHPGIAQVHAAGTARLDGAGDALPFIALELVEDACSLHEFATRHELSWRQRVDLLLQVGEAVQHGHQRGVIHRDLKPHNVLVDANGRCKVVDFGIARLVDRDAGDTRTIAGVVLGTPAYMSPEQLEGDPDAIDVRTDVYALGVMLFELLTGTLPRDFAGKPLTEALRVLRTEVAAPRPSDRCPGLPIEVDWIFAKATARGADERYGAASEFAADLRRLLADEPVSAGPPSTAYRLRKLVRRHRLALSAAGLVLFSILVALVVSLTSRAEALRERDRARREQRVAESVLGLVQDVFASADPDRLGRDVRVRDMLRGATRELDATAAIDPLVRASLDFTLGSTFVGLGLDDEALVRLDRAHRGMLEHAGPGDRRTIRAAAAYAGALRVSGRIDEALAVATRAAAAAEGLATTDEVRTDCALVLATLEQLTGAGERGIERLGKRLADLAAHGLSESAGAVALLVELGELQTGLARLTEARANLDRAVAIALRVHGLGHPRTTAVQHAHALVQEQLGQRAAAEQELRAVVAQSQDKLGPDHRATLASIANLGALLRRLDRREEASAILQEALTIYRRVFGEDDQRTLAQQNSLALLLLDQQKLPEAEKLLRDALARARRLFATTDPRLTAALQNLATVLRRRGDNDGAMALLEEALSLLERQAGADNPRTLQARFNLGVLARSRRDYERAEQLIGDALAGRREVIGEDHPDTLNAMHELARIQRARHRLVPAEATARNLLMRRRAVAATQGGDDWILAAQLLAQILDELDRPDEAGPLFDEAVAACEAAPPDRAVRTVNTRNLAADFWSRRGDKGKARALLQRNVEMFDRDPELGGSSRGSLQGKTRSLLEQLGQ